MSLNSEPRPAKSRLSSVVIENPNSPDVCVLYPPDATYKRLETMWIRAKDDGYTCTEEIR